ncbi:MAG: hypothetical protein K2L48_01770 [Mycoplasmoidaceae bacterium]|nr:hypothetical protein [Mycoplasmoidaceae bacterium]
MVDELIRKILFYSKKYKINTIAIGGGVSANRLLRKKLSSTKLKIYLPELKYCGDNATMIAGYANLIINNNYLSDN